MKYIKLNENIALAKSILRKNGIPETNEDYLKIREFVGKDYSYIGILTRLRFIDHVTDIEKKIVNSMVKIETPESIEILEKIKEKTKKENPNFIKKFFGFDK